MCAASHPLAKEPIRMYSGKVIRTRFILRLASSTCDIQVLIKVDMVFLIMFYTMLPTVVVILHMILHMILHEIPNCHPYPNLTQQNALVRCLAVSMNASAVGLLLFLVVSFALERCEVFFDQVDALASNRLDLRKTWHLKSFGGVGFRL